MTGQQKSLAQPFQLPDPTLIDLFLCGSIQRLLRFGWSAGGRSEPVACRKLPQSCHALLWRERIDRPHRAFQVEKHLFTAGHFNLVGGLNSKVLSRMAEPYPGSAVCWKSAAGLRRASDSEVCEAQGNAIIAIPAVPRQPGWASSVEG